MTIIQAQTLCLRWNIPFYSYRLPGEKNIFWGAQLEGEVETFRGMRGRQDSAGFAVVPFRETEQTPPLWIREDVAFIHETENIALTDELRKGARKVRVLKPSASSVSREDYHRQLTTMITALKQKVVSKMVLSRNLWIECGAFQQAPLWFEKLAAQYPEAFVFLVSVPGVMTWMGATPEIFLQQDEKGAETMALAGTRMAGKEDPWGEKEIEEQQIVSRYIASLLQGSGGWQIKGPFTKRAGKVEHLCTSFYHTGALSSSWIDQIRTKLHPTPAVGGFPAPEALRLLEQIEKYERRYYAGYLGPVTDEITFHWYVNLRCMEIFPQAACLYMGGGITAMSDPDKEWEETEMKSRTLLDIMNCG